MRPATFHRSCGTRSGDSPESIDAALVTGRRFHLAQQCEAGAGCFTQRRGDAEENPERHFRAKYASDGEAGARLLYGFIQTLFQPLGRRFCVPRGPTVNIVNQKILNSKNCP